METTTSAHHCRTISNVKCARMFVRPKFALPTAISTGYVTMMKRLALLATSLIVLSTSAQEWQIGAATRLTEDYLGSGDWHISYTNMSVTHSNTGDGLTRPTTFEQEISGNLLALDRVIFPNVAVGIAYLAENTNTEYRVDNLYYGFDNDGINFFLNGTWKLSRDLGLFVMYGYQNSSESEAAGSPLSYIDYDAVGSLFAFGANYKMLDRSAYNLVAHFDRVMQDQEHKNPTFKNIPEEVQARAEQLRDQIMLLEPEHYSTRLGFELEFGASGGGQGLGLSGYAAAYFLKNSHGFGAGVSNSLENTGTQLEFGARLNTSRFWMEAGYSVLNHGDAFKDGQKIVQFSLTGSL